MIGHWLLQLTPEQEAAILVEKMEGYGESLTGGWRVKPPFCLVQTVFPNIASTGAVGLFFQGDNVMQHYDDAYTRFGGRVNAAIRQRILTNRLWRTLGQVKQQVEEAVGARA